MRAFACIVADKRENDETKWHQTVVPNLCAKIARDNCRNKMLARRTVGKNRLSPNERTNIWNKPKPRFATFFFSGFVLFASGKPSKEFASWQKVRRCRGGGREMMMELRRGGWCKRRRSRSSRRKKNASQGRNLYVARGEQSLAAVPSRCVCNTQTLSCGWHRCGTPQFAFFRATLLHNCVGSPRRRMAESQLCCDHDAFRAPENWSSFLTARGVPHLLVLLVVFVAAAAATAAATAAAAVATAAWPVTIHCIHSTAI